MTTTRHLGVSYSRFSRASQAAGDSEDRQERDYRAFCSRHNLTPLPEVYADRGRSGYKDEHRKKGRLGQLIAAAKDGRFDPGTVIVVEAWDRLGRLRPDRQTELVAELLRTGVRIGICRLDDIFAEDDFGTHKWTTLAVFIQLAYQESKQKAERVAASWQARRQKAREDGRPITSVLPAWLELVGGVIRPIPERVAVVRRIFLLASDGFGRARIIGVLVREGVAPFGGVTGRWSRTYLSKILNDRRAVGEFQPRKTDDTPDGPPLPGYYPAVVTEAEFLRARAGQRQRTIGRKNPRQRRWVNVFAGLLRDAGAGAGEGFELQNKGTADHPCLVLTNARGANGRGKGYSFPYHVFETAVLGQFREVKPEDVFPREEGPGARADALRVQLANVREDLAGIKAEMRRKFSKGLAEVLRDREEDEVRVAAALQEELMRSVKPAARVWGDLPGLVDMIQQAQAPEEVRLRLRVVLARVVPEAWVLLVRRRSYQLAAVQFFFEGGAHRSYLIAYQPPARCRPGGSKVLSLNEVMKRRDLDFRRRVDVRAVEASLSSEFDPSGLNLGRGRL